MEVEKISKLHKRGVMIIRYSKALALYYQDKGSVVSQRTKINDDSNIPCYCRDIGFPYVMAVPTIKYTLFFYKNT